MSSGFRLMCMLKNLLRWVYCWFWLKILLFLLVGFYFMVGVCDCYFVDNCIVCVKWSGMMFVVGIEVDFG